MLRSDLPHELNGKPKTAAGAQHRTWSPGEPLSGIVVPLVTPLASRDEIDHDGLQRLLDRMVEGGADALFLLGTTGEAASLSPELRCQFVESAIKRTAGRVPILVGVTDNSLVTTIRQAEHASEAGADAVVVTTPFYLTPDPQEIAAYVRTIVAETPLPLFLYNMPRLTKAWFDPKTVGQLMEIDGVVGIKDSSGDMSYFRALCEMGKGRPDWSLLVGVENLIPQAVQYGGHGCVAGGAHLWPQLLSAILEAAQHDDAPRVACLQAELTKMHQIFTDSPYALGAIRAIKTGLGLVGVCSDRLAEPFATSTPEERERIKSIMAQAGLLKSGSVPAAHATSAGASKRTA